MAQNQHPKSLYQILNSKAPEYPELLKEISYPPSTLYFRGKWPDWNEGLTVAVVGARKATRFGLELVPQILEEIAKADPLVRIVSGLAFGIDAAAHRAALHFRLPTWGVLGSGIDVLYPRQNWGLAEAMLGQGGYMTEFSPGTQPKPGHFPRRNRIISGLSQGVILIEGTVKSGSLITARLALEQGREVFVVRPPNDHVMYGANWKLIEEGAPIFESAEQLLHEVRFLRKRESRSQSCSRKESPEDFPPEEVLILNVLKDKKNMDHLIQETRRPPAELALLLVQLEIKGLVQREPGGFWGLKK